MLERMKKINPNDVRKDFESGDNLLGITINKFEGREGLKTKTRESCLHDLQLRVSHYWKKHSSCIKSMLPYNTR